MKSYILGSALVATALSLAVTTVHTTAFADSGTEEAEEDPSKLFDQMIKRLESGLGKLKKNIYAYDAELKKATKSVETAGYRIGSNRKAYEETQTTLKEADGIPDKKRERLQKKLELQKSLLDKDAEKLNLMLEKATKFIAEIDELNREVKTLSDDVAIQRDRVAEGDYRIKTAERLIRETEWGLGRLEEISTGWQTDLSDSLRTTLDQTKVESD